jgi:hypothetical protein
LGQIARILITACTTEVSETVRIEHNAPWHEEYDGKSSTIPSLNSGSIRRNGTLGMSKMPTGGKNSIPKGENDSRSMGKEMGRVNGMEDRLKGEGNLRSTEMEM